jgi:two-component system chemotaxis response regulator CheY
MTWWSNARKTFPGGNGLRQTEICYKGTFKKGKLVDRRDPMVRKLMLVDDNELFRQIAARILRKAGYTVIEAVNGLDALNKLNGVEVDMVITDFRMPQMDGLEFVKTLRTVPAYTKLPIVVMTAELGTAELEAFQKIEGGKVGVSDWVSKPLLRHRLIDAIERSAIQ